MENKLHTLWITQTAIFIALLVVIQAVTMPFGSTLLTGSLVNMLLTLSVMLCGLSSGIMVAVLSPVLAKLFGIGPLWSIIPVIILGNITLIIIWHSLGNYEGMRPLTALVSALIAASVAKCAVLYFGIVKLVVPVFLTLPLKQVTVITAMFSLPQLLTAVAGGVLAIAMLPVLKRAITGKVR